MGYFAPSQLLGFRAKTFAVESLYILSVQYEASYLLPKTVLLGVHDYTATFLPCVFSALRLFYAKPLECQFNCPEHSPPLTVLPSYYRQIISNQDIIILISLYRWSGTKLEKRKYKGGRSHIRRCKPSPVIPSMPHKHTHTQIYSTLEPDR